MANTYNPAAVGSYPQQHNKRELKVLQTAFANAPSQKAKSTTSAYAIAADDGVEVIVNAGAVTVTMPNALANKGRRILFVQTTANVLTIAQNADDANIDGADANYVALDAAGDRAEFVSTGTEWLVVSSTIA